MALSKCPRCQASAGFITNSGEVAREVAGHLFLAFIPVEKCNACGEQFFEAHVVARFEQHVALRLLDAGVMNGESFRFLRKTLGMNASELAELLDVAPETVSRWETDKRAASRGACAVLGALVRDKSQGRTTTLDMLRRLQHPQPLDAKITIELE